MADSKELKPRVGMGVIVFKDGKILLAKRKGQFGNGEYQFPGGHLEYMETFEECAMRETKEECDIEIKNIRFVSVGTTKLYPPRHYVHIGMSADWSSGEPRVMEPEKSGEWDWYPLDNLPEPLFSGSKVILENYQKKRVYFNS
ncbi:MAG: NUDIX domain-containing protein [Candidatus Pacebacteria bacterium]|nr:NUDIX domain-containing protein [Candidatus Paceibacterota bacterium]